MNIEKYPSIFHIFHKKSIFFEKNMTYCHSKAKITVLF